MWFGGSGETRPANFCHTSPQCSSLRRRQTWKQRQLLSEPDGGSADQTLPLFFCSAVLLVVGEGWLGGGHANEGWREKKRRGARLFGRWRAEEPREPSVRLPSEGFVWWRHDGRLGGFVQAKGPLIQELKDTVH